MIPTLLLVLACGDDTTSDTGTVSGDTAVTWSDDTGSTTGGDTGGDT